MTQTPGTPAFMPPEVMLAKPKYDRSVDVFSFGVMMVHVLSGKWPEPQIGPTRTEAGKLIPISEAERREEFLQIIGNEHPLMESIHSCVHNDPTMRAHTNELVRLLGELVKTFPSPFANQIDVLKHIERDEEEKQYLKEELQRKEQEILAQIKELSNEIERLKLQNSELMEENRMLSSEREVLMQQIARDEEAMISTIQLLKHTIEQKQHHFDNRSTHNIETKDLNQQSQASFKQMIKELEIEKETIAQPTVKTSVQPTSDSVKDPEIESKLQHSLCLIQSKNLRLKSRLQHNLILSRSKKLKQRGEILHG